MSRLFCPQCKQRFDGDEQELCPHDGTRLYSLDAPAKEDPLIGALIDGRFAIKGLLGRGGMGAVYRGVQTSVNREVAVKVLRPELTGRAETLERFFREAKVVSELTHPNIVRLIDFGQDRERDLLYLVMELVRGRDMGTFLQAGRFRLNLALEVIYQICGALTEPHARGVIHRDLKPENVVLLPVSDGTLQVKVLDFGIARTLEGETQLTKTGMICGTPAYMSPEQAQNHELDARTDLYALGVILFEMLAGRPPFVGETSLQILLNHIQRPAPSLQEHLPAGQVPEQVEELVRSLLEKDRSNRPESAREVRDRVDAIRAELRLKPVRVEAARPFELAGWILPREERQKVDSSAESLLGLSEQPPSPREVPETDESAYAKTALLGEARRVTEKAFAPAGESVASDEGDDTSVKTTPYLATPEPRAEVGKPDGQIERPEPSDEGTDRLSVPTVEERVSPRERSTQEQTSTGAAQEKKRALPIVIGVLVVIALVGGIVLAGGESEDGGDEATEVAEVVTVASEDEGEVVGDVEEPGVKEDVSEVVAEEVEEEQADAEVGAREEGASAEGVPGREDSGERVETSPAEEEEEASGGVEEEVREADVAQEEVVGEAEEPEAVGEIEETEETEETESALDRARRIRDSEGSAIDRARRLRDR